MGAIVNALHGTSLATGIDPLWLARLSIYWEQVWPSCARSLVPLQMCWLCSDLHCCSICSSDMSMARV